MSLARPWAEHNGALSVLSRILRGEEFANQRIDALRLLVDDPMRRVGDALDAQILYVLIEADQIAGKEERVPFAPDDERRHGDLERGESCALQERRLRRVLTGGRRPCFRGAIVVQSAGQCAGLRPGFE